MAKAQQAVGLSVGGSGGSRLCVALMLGADATVLPLGLSSSRLIIVGLVGLFGTFATARYGVANQMLLIVLIVSALGIVLGREFDGAGDTMPAMVVNLFTLWGIEATLALCSLPLDRYGHYRHLMGACPCQWTSIRRLVPIGTLETT